jgi:predicted SprT family Zn-dependent metalloprotease
VNIVDAQTIARQLMNRHGLDDWHLHFDHARQRCGSCNFTNHQISLSKHFIGLNDLAEVRNTILHEIAHALAGPGVAHGPEWQAVARQIGAPIRATNATAEMPEPPWQLHCVSCTRVVAKRHRRSLNLDRTRCRYCGIKGSRLQWRHAIRR